MISERLSVVARLVDRLRASMDTTRTKLEPDAVALVDLSRTDLMCAALNAIEGADHETALALGTGASTGLATSGRTRSTW